MFGLNRERSKMRKGNLREHETAGPANKQRSDMAEEERRLRRVDRLRHSYTDPNRAFEGSGEEIKPQEENCDPAISGTRVGPSNRKRSCSEGAASIRKCSNSRQKLARLSSYAIDDRAGTGGAAKAWRTSSLETDFLIPDISPHLGSDSRTSRVVRRARMGAWRRATKAMQKRACTPYMYCSTAGCATTQARSCWS